MEEVWKDMITLTSSYTTTTSSSSKEESHAANSLTFQDFLSRRPFYAGADGDDGDDDQFHFTHISNSNIHPPLILASSTTTTTGKKRLPELTDPINPTDRRHKRMIKNRESAARSRDRKQAYTNELELEIAHLTKENARLKIQLCMELAAAAASGDHHHHQAPPKKHTLQRTWTAPF